MFTFYETVVPEICDSSSRMNWTSDALSQTDEPYRSQLQRANLIPAGARSCKTGLAALYQTNILNITQFVFYFHSHNSDILF